MAAEVERIASLCDGVRCDMAMLILPDVFERTWGLRPQSFWPEVTRRARARREGFLFMAEVYWDLEWTVQHQGFDYAYDKRLYDRLGDGHARPVRRTSFPGRHGFPAEVSPIPWRIMMNHEPQPPLNPHNTRRRRS